MIMNDFNLKNASSPNSGLREYQRQAVAAAIKNLQHGDRNGLVVMPTGSGKSIVIAEITKHLHNQQILIITPRKRLLRQLRPYLGRHGILSGNLGRDLGHEHDTIAGTFQTMTRRKGLKTPNVIIMDECHLLPPGSKYKQLIESYPNAKVLGFTATPYRGKCHITNLGLDWKEIVSVSLTELIDRGYLAPPISKATGEPHFIDEISRRSAAEVTETIVPVLTATIKNEGRMRCLVFCIDIEHAKVTQGLLKKAGENSAFLVHSGLSQKIQDAQIDAFEKSQTPAWLVNVGIVNIGVDIPCIDCIAILRDIRSFALLLQIIGRGLRLFEGKSECLIYDFGQGTQRFGFIDDPDFGEYAKGSQHHSFKTCPLCNSLIHFFGSICRRCNPGCESKTSLCSIATENQLLSADYLQATYQKEVKREPKNSLLLVEHQLIYKNKLLRAIEFTAVDSISKHRNFKVGDTVIISRIKDDIVRII